MIGFHSFLTYTKAVERVKLVKSLKVHCQQGVADDPRENQSSYCALCWSLAAHHKTRRVMLLKCPLSSRSHGHSERVCKAEEKGHVLNENSSFGQNETGGISDYNLNISNLI